MSCAHVAVVLIVAERFSSTSCVSYADISDDQRTLYPVPVLPPIVDYEKLLHALTKILRLYIQNRMSHSTARIASCSNSNPELGISFAIP